MLIDFTIENYTSFKDEKLFSLLCNTKKVKEDLALLSLYEDKYKIYPFSVLLGPNASGKTNLFKAISDFRDFVIFSSQATKDNSIPAYKPFKLNSSTIKAPITFDIEFTSNENHYSYKVIFDEKKIITEELYIFNSGKKLTKSYLFKRDSQNISYGSKIKGEKAVYKTLLLPNRLLLSVMGENVNDCLVQHAYSFFKNELDVVFPHQGLDNKFNKIKTDKIINKFPKMKKLIISLLKSADIHINNIEIKHSDEIEKALKSQNEENSLDDEFLINMFSNKTYFSHPSYNGRYEEEKEVFFDFAASESSGTNRLYELSGSIIMALIKGSVLMIDELSSCLHPNIESFIVELFSSKDINVNGAQLIINTHNVNVIDNGKLTREQIWFTDRNCYGESDLFCLDEFDKNLIRDYAKFGKSYFENRVGGLPNICFNLFKEALDTYYAQKEEKDKNKKGK